MAKIRRVVRKVKQPAGSSFDEQFWPVMLALFVFGGLLEGTVLAYLHFGDARWFANAWLWVFGIPILVCVAIWILRHVESRSLRRGIQLSIVLGLIVHWLILIVSLETNIFSRLWVEFNEMAEARQVREQLIEPVYDPVQVESHQQQPREQLLRPVETDTPDVEMQELEPEEIEHEPPTEVPPTPSPEQEIQVMPNVVQRQTPAETAPRAAAETSQLARQMPTVEPQPNERVATPQPTPQPAAQPSALTSQDNQLQRRATESEAQRAPSVPDATSQAAEPTMARAQRTEQTRPDPTTAAVATMPRRVETPQSLPRTQLAATATPATAEQTTPTEVQPANTTAMRRQASSPRVEPVRQPSPTTAPSATATARRREQQSEPQPTSAQTPVPVPNRRARTTLRPDAATVAAAVAPSPTPSSQANATAQASASAVSRTQTAAASERQPTTAEPTTSPASQVTAQSRRRATAPAPAAVADSSTGRVARQSRSATPNAAATAQTAEASSTSTSQTTEIAAASGSPRRQAVTAPQAAMAEGDPSAIRGPSATTAATTAQATRQRAGAATPTISQSVRSVTASRNTADAPPATSVAAADAARADSGSATTAPAAVAASSSSLARAATSGASSATSRPSSSGPQVSPAARVVSGSRATASNTPTIDSNAAPSQMPARSTQIAELAASPTNVASPSASQGPSGDATPTPQASEMAMTRSLGGVSGVGQAANLDRALEAADSPSLVASGSARRAEATQNTPQGAALAPSAPAIVRAALAGAQRPTASLRVTTVDAGTVAGSQQPATTTMSATGSLARANSDAESAAITAAAGQVQVDLGPTRVVSGGGASRASGGGQPDLNPSAESEMIARSNSGGTARPSIDSAVAAEAVAAPAGDGGGQPTPQGVAPMLADVGRGEPSDVEGAAGSPTAGTGDPAADDMPAVAMAGGSPSRAEGGPALPEVATSGGASGSEDEEDEEERARRLARQAMGGAPQLATNAEVLPGVTGTAPPAASGGETMGDVDAAAGAVAQASSAGGGPQADSASAQLAADVGGGGDVAGTTIVSRAEAVDGFEGTPEPGGGTSSPRRAARSAQFAANLTTPTVAMAGAPESGGADSGAPVDTTGPRAAQATAGRPGTPTEAVGAVAGDTMVEGVAESGAIAGVSSQTRSATDSGGPSVGESAATAAPVRRASVGPIELASNAATIGLPAAPSATAIARADVGELGAASDLSPMTRQSSTAITIDVDAVEGPAGIGSEIAADVGLNSRRAREDSLQLQRRTMRFVRKEAGGPPSVNTSVVISADAFRRRSSRMGEDGGDSPGGQVSQQTDEAIELGLAFLARNQLPDGSWSLQATDSEAVLVSDTAATGLALLAFQGFGHTHRDNRYATNVKRALDYLIAQQQDNGDLFIPLDNMSNRSVWLYSHGIAAIAMCEAYGMTQDPELRGAAQKAVDFIVESQHEKYGGWRYAPGLETDSSVTGWMMMALKSGELANLEVPPETYSGIERWLDLSQGSRSEPHLYRYNPYAPQKGKQEHGRRASTTMTSVGLLMRLYTGWRRDHATMQRGADFLLQNLPNLDLPTELQTRPKPTGTNNPNRDTYYWYYATQVMFHMGGEHWERWNEHLGSVVRDTQIKTGPMAGSWDPNEPVPDRWAMHAGRLYVTTMNLLSLEVHYRHLPLYEETAR